MRPLDDIHWGSKPSPNLLPSPSWFSFSKAFTDKHWPAALLACVWTGWWRGSWQTFEACIETWSQRLPGDGQPPWQSWTISKLCHRHRKQPIEPWMISSLPKKLLEAVVLILSVLSILSILMLLKPGLWFDCPSLSLKDPERACTSAKLLHAGGVGSRIVHPVAWYTR